MRSHSLPSWVGESCALWSPVTTSMSPCALTFTPATRSPAATTAFTALVKSRWRNVEGARATSLFLVVGALGHGASALALSRFAAGAVTSVTSVTDWSPAYAGYARYAP